MSSPELSIILGVTGGVSAYKSCDLLRRLQELPGVTPSIHIIPTRSSLNFVGKSLWEALSGNPVHDDMWQNTYAVPHISLARKADLIIIAPASAESISKFAHGRADDLLSATVLASTATKILVPAMHPEMYQSAAVQKNLHYLETIGFIIVQPDEGRMTGEDYGLGRYPELSKILHEVRRALGLQRDLTGVKVLVSAGGTRESIDPVRFIGNRSSGKQGYAIAQAALDRGASVTIVSANVSLPDPRGSRVIRVESADEMHTSLSAEAANFDVVVMAAAVADAKPMASNEKIAKADFTRIELQRNPDILATLTASRRADQVFIAFAAQTGSTGLERAVEKYSAKGADLLYFNDVSGGAIFGEPFTSGVILDEPSPSEEISQISKYELANKLLDRALHKLGFSND